MMVVHSCHVGKELIELIHDELGGIDLLDGTISAGQGREYNRRMAPKDSADPCGPRAGGSELVDDCTEEGVSVGD